MEIDWSKAPEWAQCVIESEEFSGQYYWAEPWGTSNGKRCAFGSEDRALRDFDIANTAGKNAWHLIESRPASIWPESGRPPIGTECEAFNDHLEEWIAVKIIDNHNCVHSAACREIGTDKLWWSDSFRPVRTAAEIAADERESAVNGMLTHDAFGGSRRGLAEALYDAGYRKVQP